MNSLAPIILFVYNRPLHAAKTVEALTQNKDAKESKLIIFSDGPKNQNDEKAVNEVRNYIKSINGFYDVVINEREENYGLAKSVIEGINEIFIDFEKIIVLEDDIVTSSKFIEFMNNSLEFYKENSSVFSISGYSFPVRVPPNYNHEIYLLKRSSSWGWATWKDRWEQAIWDNSFYEKKISDNKIRNNFNRGGSDLTPMLIKQINNKIDSWAIRWAFTHFINEGNCIYPIKSLAKNIGTDATGTNFDRKTTRYNVELDYSNKEVNLNEIVQINDDIEYQVRKIVRPGLITRIKNYVQFY